MRARAKPADPNYKWMLDGLAALEVTRKDHSQSLNLKERESRALNAGAGSAGARERPAHCQRAAAAQELPRK